MIKEILAHCPVYKVGDDALFRRDAKSMSKSCIIPYVLSLIRANKRIIYGKVG